MLDQVNFPLPYALPENTDATVLFYQAIDTAAGIINGSAGIEGGCTRCLAAITAAQVLARAAPGNFSDGAIRLCKLVKFKPDDDCERDYARDVPEVAVWAQVLQAANVYENDGRFICHSMFGQSWCDKPESADLKLDFGTEKPANLSAPPPSGKRVKVLHLSDVHLDLRYTVGAEAIDCPSGGCCRPDPDNEIEVKNPAPLNGHPNCDTPLSLLTSALSSVAPITGKNSTVPGNIEWALFTGDVLPREKAKFRNDEYLGFVQSTVFKALKYFLPQSPVFPVLGALDAFNEEPSTRHPLTGVMRDLQSKNYDRMKAIVDANQWLGKDESAAIGPHHMGYTALHPKYPKLRIIALNTNFWWLQNYYNYVNTTVPQDAIILSDLIGWLLLAEKAQERVWIVGHIPPFAGQSLPDHSGTFYQVVERFTPHVIAGIFFGHQHTDSVNIFYKAGGKDVTKEGNAAVASWIAPSLSPKNGNPSYKVYDVDTGDFGIYESRTYFTNVSTLSSGPATEPNAGTDFEGKNGSVNGLLWELGYDARKAYGGATSWPSTSALNGAFWHRVGNAMLQDKAAPDSNLAARYHMYRSTSIDGKGVTGKCDEACVKATVCRMRAAKEALWDRCSSDEVQKNESASNGSTSKRSEGSDGSIEIDITIDYDNFEIDSSGNQRQAEKRSRPGFWSKMGAMAAGFTGSPSHGASNQKAQTQGQTLQSSATNHDTKTTTVTGTLTTTVSVEAKNGGTSSMGKRAEGPETDHDIPLQARGDISNAGDFGNYKFTSSILPQTTETMTGRWGIGVQSDLMTEVQGHQSTGYQILNQVTSALKGQSAWTVYSQGSVTTPTVKAKPKPKRAVATSAQDGSPMDEASTETGDDEAEQGLLPERADGRGDGDRVLTDSAEIADRPHSKRALAPADAPDTTTTASSNVPTDDPSVEGAEPSRDFPIYRPDESLNGQILRRRPASDSEGGAVATSTKAGSPTGDPEIPDFAPTPFPETDEDYDLEALAAGVDMIDRRDENRKAGCITYSLSSVCSGSMAYVDYTPEQSSQILMAYRSGAAAYNALMKTMPKKTTSRWSTRTYNHAASKRGEERKPGCVSHSSSSICSGTKTYVEYTPQQSQEILRAYQAGRSSYNALMKTMSKKTTSRWSTWTENFAAPASKRDYDIPGCTNNDNGLVCTHVTESPDDYVDKRSAMPEPTPDPAPEPEPEPEPEPKFNALLSQWSSQLRSMINEKTYTPWTTGNTNKIHAATWEPDKRTAPPKLSSGAQTTLDMPSSMDPATAPLPWIAPLPEFSPKSEFFKSLRDKKVSKFGTLSTHAPRSALNGTE